MGTADRVVFAAAGIFSNDPDAEYGGMRFINSGVFILPIIGGITDDRYLGPTARLAVVPEPTTLLLVGVGLATAVLLVGLGTVGVLLAARRSRAQRYDSTCGSPSA